MVRPGSISDLDFVESFNFWSFPYSLTMFDTGGAAGIFPSDRRHAH